MVRKTVKKLSIITPTLNNESDLIRFLNSIKKQKKRTFTFEHVFADGGSTDNTVKIARSYGAKVYKNKHVLAEPGISLGMQKATGDYCMVLAVDNLFYSTSALEKIVSALIESKAIAAFPKHDSKKHDSLYTKYINTFTDPYNHFIYGNAANPRFFGRVYSIQEEGVLYTIYDFKSSDYKPMIAFAQGFTIKRSALAKRAHDFDDIAPVEDLIAQGKRIAYVKGVSVYHHTIRDTAHFVRKVRWATNNAVTNKDYGIALRAHTLSQSQILRKKLWPIYAFSVLIPLVRSMYGLAKDKEAIWLFHPIICFLSASASLYEILQIYTRTNKPVSRA